MCVRRPSVPGTREASYAAIVGPPLGVRRAAHQSDPEAVAAHLARRSEAPRGLGGYRLAQATKRGPDWQWTATDVPRRVAIVCRWERAAQELRQPLQVL